MIWANPRAPFFETWEPSLFGGGATNVWGVADINEAKTHLDAHGVKQDGEIQHVPDMVKLITFFDPDGNAMMLAQTLLKQS